MAGIAVNQVIILSLAGIDLTHNRHLARKLGYRMVKL